MAGSSNARRVEIPLADGSGLLEGRLCEAESDTAAALIAAPHPLYGGSFDVPVVLELERACAAVGCSTLCFNWRGIGASQGTLSGVADAADADFRAARARLVEGRPKPLLLCGYSFGAAAAVRSVGEAEGVGALVLVAPPPALVDVDLLRGFRGPVLLVAGSEDELAPGTALQSWADEMEYGTLEWVAGADHFFGTTPGAVSDVARVWLQARFQSAGG